MNRYHPGDIIEIRTEQGLAYVHLTHEHSSYPPVVRVLKGAHRERPANLTAHVARAPRMTAMIPLEQALDRLGLAHEKVATVALPEAEQPFPTFRMPIRDKQGEIVYWWFWDGKGLSYSVELDADQEAMPLREVMSAARLLQELMTAA